MGKKIRLKDDVVPHKNMFPVDEVPNELTESTRKQNAEYLHRAEVSSIIKAKRMIFEDVEQTTPSKKTAIASTSYNHVGIQVRPKVISQSTSTQDLVQPRSVGTLTKETDIQD